MSDWTERYRPSSLGEIRGNNKARDQFQEWAETWEDHREAVILYGRPGVGKTSAAHALARDMDWDVMELNASDSRTKDVVNRIAGEASKSGTLGQGSGGRRLIILDEADNFHGNADYGGARAVTGVVKDADQPVVLIANEYYEMSRGLRNACQEIEFRDISPRSIVPVLRDICRKENIEFEESALQTIAEGTDGDLRSAINDLQAIAEGRSRVTEDDVVTGRRDTTVDIFPFLDAVLQEKSAQDALQTAYDVDETPDELLQWIEENVPKEYSGKELTAAYDHLSIADRWLGRVRASQNYTFWRYATDAMVAGVAASRREDKHGWTRYGAPSFRRKLGQNSGHRNTRDTIARKIAETEGMSIGTARRIVLPFLGAMVPYCRPRELTVAITAAYDLDAEEISFLTGSGETTNKVESIVADAEQQQEDRAVEAMEGAFEGTPIDFDQEEDQPVEQVQDEHEEEEPEDTDSQAGLDEFF